MRISVKHSRDHRGRKAFRPYVNGQHAILLADDNGDFRGELVWRLANVGQGIAEITGFGIEEEENRRKGYGSLLLQRAIEDITNFMKTEGIEPRLVYLFRNHKSGVARSFYIARGFEYLVGIPGLYRDDIACIYLRKL